MLQSSAWLLTLAFVAAPATSDEILPDLEGVELEEDSGFVLLAQGAVVHVDSGERQTIDGLPSDMEGWWAEQVGDSVVVTVDCVDCGVRPETFVFGLDGDLAAQRIATERFVTPGASGTLLAIHHRSPTSCSLERIDLGGELLERLGPIGCHVQLDGEVDAGIIARTNIVHVVLDPENLAERARWDWPLELHAIVADRAVVSEDGKFTIVDLGVGDIVQLAGPDAHGDPSVGAVSPDNRYVAIEYRSPAQIIDLWVLDLERLAWIHAPSMPVHALVKRPAPIWTADGRLALVGPFGRQGAYRHLLAVWRPGDANFAIREVDSDAVMVLVG